MRRGAIEAMLPYLDRWFGNASGSHRVAREARRGLEEARDAVARATGRSPHGVVFTSGGTEADNLAVNGILQARGGRAVCSAVEHHAVLDPVRASGGEVIGVDR
ncbi:MAG TPA: aminotransferase class V-fold PLP-dependent enzyme, partial [Acidimicrobiales bacterium]|nr:aminotransferase class V-fold PLP-dependent enzyme [Acidimicrobiales bacterium]